MSFCANCGTQLNVGAKFCPGCGQPTGEGASQPTASSPAAETAAQRVEVKAVTATDKESTSIVGVVKKELLQLSNTYFSLYAISLFLMKVQVEGGFKSALADTGEDSGAVLIVLLIIIAAAVGLTYFTVRIQGINKGKPGWVLSTLIVIAVLTAMGWTSANFSNFNWADWASEAVGLVQLYLLYAIYQILNKAKVG